MCELRSNRIRRRDVLAGVLIASGLASLVVAGEPDEADKIGEVLGRPVYRCEIRTTGNVQLRGELHRLFTRPWAEQYRQAHRSEIEPTEEEIAHAAAWFDKSHRERIKDEEAELLAELNMIETKLARPGLTEDERRELESRRRVLQARLDPPGRAFAGFMLKNWKFQRHLYDRYGGGRILWQQAGQEAFDAMHNWLKDQEKQGKFKIADPELRSAFYDYWTTMKHGAFLTDDKEQIRSEFLEPDWAPKRPTRE